jgi:hypothetical protein
MMRLAFLWAVVVVPVIKTAVKEGLVELVEVSFS